MVRRELPTAGLGSSPLPLRAGLRHVDLSWTRLLVATLLLIACGGEAQSETATDTGAHAHEEDATPSARDVNEPSEPTVDIGPTTDTDIDCRDACDIATDAADANVDGAETEDSSSQEDVEQSDDGASEPMDAVDGEDGPDTSLPLWPPPRSGCNGDGALCDRTFDAVVFPATHNAMSNNEDRWFAANQNRNIGNQLRDGVRAMLLDIHPGDDEVLLCHASCRIGQRPLLDALEEIYDFLAHNPNEVFTIIFEDYVSEEDAVVLLEASRLAELVYAHTPGQPWPTLGDMIDRDERVVIMAQSGRPPPAWYHNAWAIMWDTPYSFGSVDDFVCSANRGSIGHSLFLVNHWVLAPAAHPSHAEIANQRAVLLDRVADCHSEWGRLPTFIAVDFYDIGELFEVVDDLNQRGTDAWEDGSR